MANEISATLTLTANKGTNNIFSFSRSRTFNATLNTSRKADAVQNIGTTAEALSIHADLTTLGWAHFTNHDTTNYVEIGRDVTGTFYPLVRLNAGESAMFRLSQGIAASLFARANTAAVDLEMNILND